MVEWIAALLSILLAIGAIIGGVVQHRGRIVAPLRKHYEFLRATLQRKLSASKKTGAALKRPPEATPDLPLLPPSLMDPIRSFRSVGRYREAFDWALDCANSVQTWELLVHLLALADLLGEPNRGLHARSILRDSLTDAVPPRLRKLERYFVARLMGQQGHIAHALNLHRENMQESLDIDIMIRGRFEIGRLLFQVEAFEQAQDELHALWKVLQELGFGHYSDAAADVLQFLGTFQMIHLVHDLPFAAYPLSSRETNGPSRCLEYAEMATDFAAQRAYIYGTAWALVVRALAFEGLGEFAKADSCYKDAEVILEQGTTARTALIYVLVYHGSFSRRRRDFEAAEGFLTRADRVIPWAEGGSQHQAHVLEHWSLYWKARGEDARARDAFTRAMECYALDLAFPNYFDWPKVTRLRKTSEFWGLDFDLFFSSRVQPAREASPNRAQEDN